ncbi:hypothetical protein Pmar_PMAR018291, partial [Perkinsus marinus ATCC 50983]
MSRELNKVFEYLASEPSSLTIQRAHLLVNAQPSCGRLNGYCDLSECPRETSAAT